MKPCDIVKDLLPLYVEGLTRPGSAAMVEAHLAECDDCKGDYEMIKQDYEQHEQKKPDQKQLDELVLKLAKYQKNIKLAGVLVAMLLSCIIAGADVQFLSTIPFLFLTPFACRLYYNKSLPILFSSIPFGIIGGMLSEYDSSYIPFFTVIALLASGVGVGAGALVKRGLKQHKAGLKALAILPAVVILAIGCTAYFSFYGNPVGYIETLVKTNQYVNQTYEKGTLTFKGVSYNFKDSRHYGNFEYVLNGTRQVAPIGMNHEGQVIDHYKTMLEMQFCEERSADLKTEIAAAINHIPVTIFAKPEAELNITRDELNDTYYVLSYDLERRNKATETRKRESGKLSYEISFGPFSNEYVRLSKEEFLDKSVAILHALKERHIPYKNIFILAEDLNGHLQSVSFQHQATEQELIQSYTLTDKADAKFKK